VDFIRSHQVVASWTCIPRQWEEKNRQFCTTRPATFGFFFSDRIYYHAFGNATLCSNSSGFLIEETSTSQMSTTNLLTLLCISRLANVNAAYVSNTLHTIKSIPETDIPFLHSYGTHLQKSCETKKFNSSSAYQ